MRQKMIIASSVFAALTIGLIVFLNFSHSEKTFASSTGDYRSKTSGNWNSSSTWERFNGTTWVAAASTPTDTCGTITILNGHTVTVTASVSVDQVTINSGGQITLSNGTFSVQDGSGDDLTVTGTLNMASTLTLKTQAAIKVNGLAILATGGTLTLQGTSTITVNSGGRYRKDGGSQTTTAGAWIVNSGGIYQHNDNGTTVPNITWNAGSTCEITGVTNTKPSNLDQEFYNIKWNCTSQTSKENISSANLNTVDGDFTLISTGTGSIELNQGANVTYEIVGNLNIQGGSMAITESGSPNVNITGNYNQTGGSFNMTDASSSSGSGTPTLNVAGNFSISGGTFNMSQYTLSNVNNGKGTLNLSGDFNYTGGTITETALLTGKGIINFTKSGTQVVTGGGTISNVIDFSVASGSILNLGTSVISGAGTFTANSGAGLLIGSSGGISASPLTGNIQVTGTKTFSTDCDYTYNGSSAQVTGTGLPATVHNLTLNNSAGLTLSATVAVSNVLALTSGKITTGALYEVSVTNTSAGSITGYSSSNYVVGSLRRSVSGSGTYDFPLGTSANYELGTITLSSATGFSNILGTFTNSNPVTASLPLVNVLLSVTPITSMLNYGYWTFTPNSTMTGGTYSVSLNEKGATNANTNPQSFCILKRTNILSSWASIGTHNNNTQSIASSVVTAVRSGLTGFSDFGVGESSGGSLPIKLIYFTAKLNDNIVNLDWATAAEVNNDFFTVERSSDGEHFDALLTKPGAGNSTINLYYSNKDENPLSGYSYYRLKQTDYDGHYTYSDIETVKLGDDKSDGMYQMEIKTVAPNPFNDNFKVTFMIKSAVVVDFSLMNSAGQTVAQEKIQSEEGMNTFEFIDKYNIKKGIYFMTLVYNDQKITKKIIKE